MDKKEEMKAALKTVVLSEAASKKIDLWLDQAANKRVELSRKEFLNWYLEKASDSLSSSELNALVERFYDEEAYLRHLLREVRIAKQSGSNHQLEIVVKTRKNEIKRETITQEEKPHDQSP